MQSSSRRAWLEIGLVAATAAANAVVADFRWKPVVIGVSVLVWAAYVAVRIRENRSVLRAWGLRCDGLARASRSAAVVLAVGTLVLAGLAARRGTLVFEAAMLPVLILYPMWGIVQQLLVQGMVVRHLAVRLSSGLLVTALAALLFGIVHWPDPRLMAATAALGASLTPIWLKHRNLWPLGVVHGWLGVLCYHWILDRVPWREMAG